MGLVGLVAGLSVVGDVLHREYSSTGLESGIVRTGTGKYTKELDAGFGYKNERFGSDSGTSA